MWNFVWPIILVITANCFYNISTKSMPDTINPFAALVITYSVAAIVSYFLFFINSGNYNLITGLKNINWTSIVLGFTIIGLEAGYIYAYRNGWQIVNASLTANILLAIVLVFVGVILYKESVTLKQLLGILICCLGLYLIV